MGSREGVFGQATGGQGPPASARPCLLEREGQLALGVDVRR